MNQEKIPENIPPMYQNRYLAHSLGGYRGFKYLNSEEGLLHAILHGHRYFEVDLLFTEDGELVCSHGWNEANCEKTGMPYKPEFEHMTRACFLEQKVHGFTTMDAARLYQYMVMFPDTYWELDLHTLPKEVAVRMAQKLLEVFEHNQDVLDRCLVQVNSKAMYAGINSVFHFKYYQYNIKNAIDKLDDFIAFSVENGICAMAMKSAFATKKTIEKVRNAGLCLLVFTVDNYVEAQNYLRWGANTICTNFLSPEVEEEQMNRTKIVYNSTPNAGERITKLIEKKVLRGSLVRTVRESYEYIEEIAFSQEGTYQLMENLFHKGFRRFLGWNVRRRDAAGQWEWLCTDGKWRAEKNIPDSGYSLRLFENCAVIDKELVGVERKLFFVAKWK
jgi:glycerophosphoryl diester phosphodiesterase